MSNLYRFVRSVSPQDLRSHLSQNGIPLPANLNWDASAEEFSQGFLKAVDELPEQQLIQLIADIDRISDMTDEVGQAALMDLAEWRDRLAAIEGAHKRAHWLYVQSRDAFRQAEEIRHADENQNAQRLWDGFVGPRLLELKDDPQIVEQFRDAVRGLLGAGRVHVEIFSRVRNRSGEPDREIKQITVYSEDCVAVALDDQKLLRVSVPWWLAWLAGALKLTNCSQPTELVERHAWDVGDLWIDRRRKVPVIFARRLHRAETCQALTEILKKRAGRCDPLILTSSRNPPSRLDAGLTLAPVSILAVLTNDADDFALDRELVLSPYGAAGNTGPTDPLYLSPDGRLLVLKGVEVKFKSPIHVEIIRQIVSARPSGVLAREVLEKAGSAAPTLQKAFGRSKWMLLKPYLKSKDGLWSFDL